jgi:hypothetical protein
MGLAVVVLLAVAFQCSRYSVWYWRCCLGTMIRCLRNISPISAPRPAWEEVYALVTGVLLMAAQLLGLSEELRNGRDRGLASLS